MFDTLLSDRARRRPWSAVAIAISALAHVVVGTTVVVLAMWQLDKLAPEPRPLVLVTPPDPTAHAREPEPAAAPPPAARAATGVERRRARPLTQPSEQAGADEPADSGPEGDGDGVGVASIHSGDGDCLTCTGGLEGGGPPPVVTAEPPPIVPPHLLAGHRLEGNDRIAPPEPVRLAMRRADQSQLVAVTKMCLGRDGRVRSLEVLSSSGYPQYDAEILREMRTWRYRPYQVDGEPVPVCTAVTFIFRLQR